MIGLAMMLAATGSFKTGNGLWELCSAGSTGELTCIGYVVGAIDGAISAQRASGKPTICVPTTATQGQVTDIVVKYLRDHPERRQYGAGSLIIDAMETAFPCT